MPSKFFTMENESKQPEDTQVTLKKSKSEKLPAPLFLLFTKNRVFIFLGMGIFVGLFLVIYLLGSKNSKITTDKTSQIKPTAEEIKKAEYEKISADSMKFIEGQYRSDGFYNYVYKYDDQCITINGKKECPFNGEQMFETTNAWTALAYYGRYKSTGDKKNLELALRDLYKLYDWCEKDRKQCLWVLVQPALIYQTTKDVKTLEFLKTEGAMLASTPPSNHLMLQSVEVRELLLIGNALNDQKMIDEGERRLNNLNDAILTDTDFYPEPKKKFAKNTCWVALANTASPKDKYQNLANVKAFVDNGKLVENFDQFQSPVEIQPCIEVYQIIGFETGNIESKIKANKLIELSNATFLDSPQNRLTDGSNGYVSMRKNSTLVSKFPKLKTLSDGAYNTYLMSYL